MLRSVAEVRGPNGENEMQVKFSSTASGRITADVPSLKSAIRFYEEFRNSSGLGASELSVATVRDGNTVIAYIRYNGRLWRTNPNKPGAVPMMLVSLEG